MRKLTQPFGEFGSSMSVSIQGADLRTAEGKRTLNAVYGEIARFVLACRAVPSNSQQYDAKSINRPLWSAQYSKIAAQEYLRVQLRGGYKSPVEEKEKKPTEADMKCLLILYGSNRVIATDMLTVGPGKMGAVVYSATLKASDFTLVPAPAETADWTENQFDPRTLQMTNSKKMGPCVVTPFSIEDYTIKHDYRFHVWRIGITDISSKRLAVSSYFNLFPTLNANDTTIYADRHSFSVGSDGSLFETSASVWGEADYWTEATLMHSSLLGSPRYIDSELYAHYWFALMFKDETIDVSINQNGSSFYDAVNPEAYYPPDIQSGDVNNELRRRSVGGGLTTYKYPDTTFPFPYLTQADGVDTLNTQYCSIEGSSTNIDTKIIKYVLEGQLLDTWNWMSSDKSRLYIYSFPYPTERSTWTTSLERYNDEYIDYMTTYYGDEIRNGFGRIATANGMHYFQMWSQEDPAVSSTAYMDAVNCTSDLEKVVKGSAVDVKAVYMDVPLSWIKKLK